MPTSLTAPEFLAKYNRLFADNAFENITEETFRALTADLEASFATKRGITTNSIRGGLYRVANRDAIQAIPAEMRILEMQAVALNGVSAAAALAGEQAPAVYFQLRRHSAGDVNALLDERAETTVTTKASWVQVSGDDEEKVQSYPAFVLTPLYKKGDPFKYTFPTGETRLFEAGEDVVGEENPLPTGEETDVNYIPFAPLRVASDLTAEQLLAFMNQSASDGTWRLVNGLLAFTLGVGKVLPLNLSQEVKNGLAAPLPTSRLLVVHAAGQTEPGIRGRWDRPFATLQQAHTAAAANDLVVVLPAASGAYASFTATKNLFWSGLGAPTVAADLLLGAYQGATPYNMRWQGFRFAGMVAALKQTRGTSKVLLVDCLFEDEGYLLVQAVGVTNPVIDTVEVRQCRFTATSSNGCIRIAQRNDLDQVQNVIVDNCLLQSTATHCITGTIHPDSRLILRGPDVRIRPAGAYKLHSLTRINSTDVLADGQVLVSEQPASAGGGTENHLIINSTAAKRVFALKLTGPVQLLGVLTSPADNASGAVFQVAKWNGTVYQGLGQRAAWDDATLTSELAAVTAAERAAGARLEINTTATVAADPSTITLFYLHG